jgi:hypothetical protein
MSEKTRNKIRFITFMIAQFVEAYKMGKSETYLYLRQCRGFDYLKNNWRALLIQNLFWVLAKFKRPTHHICFCSEKALKTL